MVGFEVAANEDQVSSTGGFAVVVEEKSLSPVLPKVVPLSEDEFVEAVLPNADGSDAGFVVAGGALVIIAHGSDPNPNVVELDV